jgi:hypothetical protein
VRWRGNLHRASAAAQAQVDCVHGHEVVRGGVEHFLQREIAQRDGVGGRARPASYPRYSPRGADEQCDRPPLPSIWLLRHDTRLVQSRLWGCRDTIMRFTISTAVSLLFGASNAQKVSARGFFVSRAAKAHTPRRAANQSRKRTQSHRRRARARRSSLLEARQRGRGGSRGVSHAAFLLVLVF